MKEGKELREIENLLERRKEKGGYSVRDIGVVINYVLGKQMNPLKSDVIDKTFKKDSLVEEQKMFLDFLEENSGRDFGTTEIYNVLGLSSRKGNEVKKKNLTV